MIRVDIGDKSKKIRYAGQIEERKEVRSYGTKRRKRGSVGTYEIFNRVQ